jgi:hypothetical protein
MDEFEKTIRVDERFALKIELNKKIIELMEN